MKIGRTVRPGRRIEKKRTGQDRTGQSKKSQRRYISPVWGEAPTEPIFTKNLHSSCRPRRNHVCKLLSWNFRSYDFTGCRISRFPIDSFMGLTTVRCDYPQFFLSSSGLAYIFSLATLRARWTELNQNWPDTRKWARFENLCPKSVVSPPPTNQGPKTTFSRRLRNLTANLTAYIFGTKHDIHNRASALHTTSGLRHRLKTTWTSAHKRLKIGPAFYRPSVDPAFYFIALLRRRR